MIFTPDKSVIIPKTICRNKPIPIIKSVDLKIAAGEVITIFGKNAAGKSSLARLLAGVVRPTSGVVRLDGADICAWQDEQINKYVGFLPQETELFSGTVAENIAKLNNKAKAHMVIESAKFTEAHEVILRFPKGYQTDLSDLQSPLSNGLLRRVALARAFFGHPKLVILDEPNLHLDQEGDNAIVNIIARARQKKITLIIISHRNEILKVSDKLIYMEEGRVKAYGNTEKFFAEKKADIEDDPLIRKSVA